MIRRKKCAALRAGRRSNMPVPFPQEMYSAIAAAETGGEINPYIRTRVRPKKGSTAFGPVQLTGTTAEDYVARNVVSPEAANFYKSRMAPMYKNFATYGNEPNRPGYDAKWEYGGTGGFNSATDSQGYQQLSTEIMSDMWRRADGDPDKFIQLWRGVDKQSDPKYYGKVMNKFKGKKK